MSRMGPTARLSYSHNLAAEIAPEERAATHARATKTAAKS